MYAQLPSGYLQLLVDVHCRCRELAQCLRWQWVSRTSLPVTPPLGCTLSSCVTRLFTPQAGGSSRYVHACVYGHVWLTDFTPPTLWHSSQCWFPLCRTISLPWWSASVIMVEPTLSRQVYTHCTCTLNAYTVYQFFYPSFCRHLCSRKATRSLWSLLLLICQPVRVL